MKFFCIIGLTIIPFLGVSQNEAFRAALVDQIRQLSDGETLIVEYKKSGDWGDYEGGYLSFYLIGEDVKITLTNTNQNNKPSDTTVSTRTRKDLIHKLNTTKDLQQDPDNVVFNNRIYYNITKEGKSLARISSSLTPDQVVNKVELNPTFSEFLKQGQNKKAGILINNIH